MVTQERQYTVQDLWRLSGEEKRYELIEGELVEMSPTGDKHTEVTLWLGSLIATHVLKNGLGAASGADGGYILHTAPLTVVAPDVGFIAQARVPPMTGKYYPVAPDLAVEVFSPADSPRQLRRKVKLYLQAGTQMVWVVYPDERFIDVYRPDAPTITLEGDDVLDGGDVLPGFAVAVHEVFQYLRG